MVKLLGGSDSQQMLWVKKLIENIGKTTTSSKCYCHVDNTNGEFFRDIQSNEKVLHLSSFSYREHFF